MSSSIYVIALSELETENTCDIWIGPGYYWFASSYQLCGSDSVLAKTAEHFNLDLLPLKEFYSDEWELELNDQSEIDKYIDECKVKIDYILPIIEKLRDSVLNSPHYLKEIEIKSKDSLDNKDLNERYTSSPQFIADLDSVIESINYYKNRKETHILFAVAL